MERDYTRCVRAPLYNNHPVLWGDRRVTICFYYGGETITSVLSVLDNTAED